MERKQSELLVITKAKDLCSYVMVITQKSGTNGGTDTNDTVFLESNEC